MDKTTAFKIGARITAWYLMIAYGFKSIQGTLVVVISQVYGGINVAQAYIFLLIYMLMVLIGFVLWKAYPRNESAIDNKMIQETILGLLLVFASLSNIIKGITYLNNVWIYKDIADENFRILTRINLISGYLGLALMTAQLIIGILFLREYRWNTKKA